MDDLLPITYFDFINAAFTVAGTVVLVCVINAWVVIAGEA